MHDSQAGDARQIKGAQNQALFREVNERIAEGPYSLEVLCECADTACTEPIPIIRADYEAIRRHPARFPVLPGHEQPDIERIVEEGDGYVVVEKIGLAATIAEKLDPRARA